MVVRVTLSNRSPNKGNEGHFVCGRYLPLPYMCAIRFLIDDETRCCCPRFGRGIFGESWKYVGYVDFKNSACMISVIVLLTLSLGAFSIGARKFWWWKQLEALMCKKAGRIRLKSLKVYLDMMHPFNGSTRRQNQRKQTSWNRSGIRFDQRGLC